MKPPAPRRIIALDGEGHTLANGSHRYTYLAACDRDGPVAELHDPQGLPTRAVLEWLLDLPRGPGVTLVGFSLGYDRTKWLEGLDDETLWRLDRPEERPGKHGPRPVNWAGYRLNLLATKFSVGRKGARGPDGLRGKGRSCVVWDVFRFFQTSFVKALVGWDVGSKLEVERIAKMKAKRGSFAAIGKAERAYCRSECVLLAQLVEALLEAHEQEGLHLKNLYGPGSTAAIVLKRCGADIQAARPPKRMALAVASAFAGGRFECSHVGPCTGRGKRKALHSYDIASAYPYALAQLPCLRPSHGKWVHVKGKACAKFLAGKELPGVFSYEIRPIPGDHAWGPLPHRLPPGHPLGAGRILFPVSGAGGWAWAPELRQAMRMHAGVTVLEGWVWQPGKRCGGKCKNPHPFCAEVVSLFTWRLAWGKAARGLVLKLALNSMYGKSAQSVGGGGRYRCMVRAGLITAITRSMLLEAVQRAPDPWDVLELATDSVLSRVPLELPAPLELGTEESAARAGKLPLGGWEHKELRQGVFLLRPGMRFELGTRADVKRTAARGLGTRVLHKNRGAIVRAWERAPMVSTTVQQPSMFHGSKSSVRGSCTVCKAVHRVLCLCLGETWEYRRGELYGRWERPTKRTLSYSPGPKREGFRASDMAGKVYRLVCWDLPMTPDARSAPYTRALGDDEERTIKGEQPEQGLGELV